MDTQKLQDNNTLTIFCALVSLRFELGNPEDISTQVSEANISTVHFVPLRITNFP